MQAPEATEILELLTLFNQGHYSITESRARELIARFPAHGFGWKVLGVVLRQQGQITASLLPMQKAAELLPDDAEAHSNLGVALMNQGQLSDAVISYRRALALHPDYVDVHHHLGLTLMTLGQLTEAADCYRRVLTLNPDYFDAHYNLGRIFQEQGQLSEAEACYRSVLTAHPDNAEVHNNLGMVFQQRGQLIEAQASYQRALAIKPNDAQIYNNLGMIYQNLGRTQQAETSFRRALVLNPDYTEAHSNLLFAMNDHATHSPAACLAEARQYGLGVKNKVDACFTDWHCETQPERLRVGMVLGDLTNYFLSSFLPELDNDSIELIAYPTHLKTDELSVYFAACKPLTGLSDAEAARLIHADGVHILLDLSGHSHHNRLLVFAWKPAPIQVSWLGLLATSGLAEMDYILGDTYATPLKDSAVFSEHIWQLPESYCCFSVPEVNLEVNQLPALTSNGITFGSFNPLSKMNDAVVALWARILQAVPYSRLLLKTAQLDDAQVCHILRQRFAEQGILPERLLLEGSSSQEERLAAYHRVDIALDTFPHSATTTSMEALWMAVPVITRAGDRFIARCGESILSNAGLENWIAEDDEDYLARAVYFAWDIASLAELREQLRQQVEDSPLFDAVSFARNFEAALWSMYPAPTNFKGQS